MMEMPGTESKDSAKVKAIRKMRREYNWAHLESNQDTKFAIKSDHYKNSNLTDKLSELKKHFNKEA